MLVAIPDLLSPEQVRSARSLLDSADWIDGKVTAGPQSARPKNNQQVGEGSAVAESVGDMILTALQRNALFVSAALPLRVFPPLFNRYQGGRTRSATTWTTRFARLAPPDTAFAPISPRRCSSPNRAVVRSRRLHSTALTRRSRASIHRAVDRRVPQPASPMGRDVRRS